MNKLIAGALVVLVLLVAFSLLLTSLNQKNQQQVNAAPTPIPTVGLEAKSGTTFNNTWETNYRPVKTNGLSDSQQSNLDALKKKLPFENDKLAIDYSPFLNQFFVQEKTPDAEQALNDFLQQNNVADLKNTSGLFKTTKDSPKIAILKAEDAVTKNLQEEGGTDNSAEPTQALTAPEQQFVDVAKTLTDFQLNVNPPAGKSGGGSANCTNTTGNVKIACESLNLLGLPYANGTEGVPIRFAGHPPGPWVDARNAGDARYKYLDCSGLASVAVFKAFGAQNPPLHDRNYCSANFLHDSANFRVLGSLHEIKPGDLVVHGTSCGNSGHVAVVVSYDGGNNMEVSEAYSHRAPSARRPHRLNSGDFNFAVRYIGPGSTP